MKVNIDSKFWMNENLDVQNFKNGDLIPEAKTDLEWEIADQNCSPAWCYYDNDLSNGKLHSKLYNWYAVNDSRGLAPKGWRIPSSEEWNNLFISLGFDMNGFLKNDQLENSIIKSINLTSGGYRDIVGTFCLINQIGFWWCSDELNKFFSIAYSMVSGNKWKSFHKRDYSKGMGYSVRCIEDSIIS